MAALTKENTERMNIDLQAQYPSPLISALLGLVERV